VGVWLDVLQAGLWGGMEMDRWESKNRENIEGFW
jgi:hypothetical protein